MVPVVSTIHFIHELFLFLLQSQDSEDEDKYADDVDMPGQKFETKQRITVRNLRIREDTAKVRLLFKHSQSSIRIFNYHSGRSSLYCIYFRFRSVFAYFSTTVGGIIFEFCFQYLYNLDPNSAFYDPKTRSMRENPYKNTGNIEME